MENLPEGVYACSKAGRNSGCPRGWYCRFGDASMNELRCYTSTGVDSDGSVTGPDFNDTSSDDGGTDEADGGWDESGIDSGDGEAYVENQDADDTMDASTVDERDSG